MYMYIYIYIHIHTHTYIYIHIIHIYIYIPARISTTEWETFCPVSRAFPGLNYDAKMRLG